MGKRACLLAKLKANTNTAAISSLFLANIRSLDSNVFGTIVFFLLTETWLDNNMPELAFHLTGCYSSEQIGIICRGKLKEVVSAHILKKKKKAGAQTVPWLSAIALKQQNT